MIQSWVEDGGGLLLMGDWTPTLLMRMRISVRIIAGYDMNITETVIPSGAFVTTNITMHPVGGGFS